MAGRFRWFLAELEQTPSGHWRIKPDVTLPQGTHLRYWSPPSQPNIGLVRIWNEDPSKLDEIEAKAGLADWVRRIPLDKTWGQVKGNALVQRLRTRWPILDQIPNGWSLDQVVAEIIDRLDGPNERRTATLPFMGDSQPPEE